MAKARVIRGLGPTTRFGDAAAAAMETRTSELFALADGVLDTSDIESVHDMRVATRRLRAAMEVFAACFPKKLHRRALREVKDLADALGERRDPDVHIEAMESFAAAADPLHRPGVETLIAHLRARQTDANLRLGTALAQVRENDLHGRLRALAGAAVAEPAA